MKCPNCEQEIEDGAVFCGNCGQPLGDAPSPIGIGYQNASAGPTPRMSQRSLAAVGAVALPGYTLVGQSQHADEIKAMASLICGVLGLASVLLIPLLALFFGATAIVIGTMSRHHRRILSTFGIIAGGLAVAAGLAMWVYAASHSQAVKQTVATRNNAPISTTQAVVSATVETPCYATGFVDQFNVSQSTTDSCDMSAFNGASMNASSNIYKVYGNQVASINAANFGAIAKQAIEKDVNTTLPGFEISSEQAGLFSGSPAFAVYADDKTNNVAVIEAAVLHPAKNGYNFFILVHATNGLNNNLSTLESQWQWK